MISSSRNKKEVEVAKRITKNTISLLGARICEVASGILSVAIIARYFGLSLYGAYAFITSTVSVVIIVSYFGLQQILIREIAQDRSTVGAYFGTALIVRGLLSMLVIMTVLILAHLINFSPLEQKALYICTLSEIFLSFTTLFISVFNAYEKMVYDALFTAINRLAHLILICIVVWLDAGFVILFWAIAIANLMGLIGTSAFLILKKHVKPQFRYDTDLIKYFCIQALPLGLGHILRMYFLRIDVFILRFLKSTQDIALFFGPYSIILRLQILSISFSLALFPVFSRLSKDSDESFRNTFMNALKALVSIGIFITVAVFYWADEIVLMLFGSEFVNASLVLRILAASICFMFLDSLFLHALVAQKKQWITAISNGVTFLVNLVLDLALVPSYGYAGAAIATSIAYISRFFITCLFVSKYMFPLPLGKVVSKPLCAGVIVSGLLWVFRNTNNLVAFIFAAIIYLWFLWLSNFFEKREIEMFRKVFSGIVSKRIGSVK